jgi:hypothetical protein
MSELARGSLKEEAPPPDLDSPAPLTAVLMGSERGTDVFEELLHTHCPSRKTPKRAVEHPVRPYKIAIERRFTRTMENANAA